MSLILSDKERILSPRSCCNSNLQDGAWLGQPIFKHHCVFCDSTNEDAVNLGFKLKQSIWRCRLLLMLMLFARSLWKNKPPIPSTFLQASARARVRRGLGSSLWEHEKPASVLGPQWTEFGLILVGLNTHFRS